MSSFKPRSFAFLMLTGALAACSNSVGVINSDASDTPNTDTRADATHDGIGNDVSPDVANDITSDVPPDVPFGDATDGSVSCTSNAMCASNEYCAGTGCGTPGSCQPRPMGCPTIYDPVCGCDGRTYGNSCEANVAGQRVASAGMCGSTDGGTACGTNADCAASSYCAGTGCGTPGACQPRPSICSGIYDPVCGCDGATYGNPCMAAAAGVRVSSAGPCSIGIDAGSDGGVSCGGGAPCPFGQSCCAATGLCYPSACLGCCMPMPPPPDASTGCVDNSTCASTDYCAGSGCGTPGTCAPRPSICSAVYDPVCGCDGVTYGNSCEAAAAGVRVQYAGPCAIVVVDGGGIGDGGGSTDGGGPIPCSAGGVCPSGEACCATTGLCYNPSCLACCH